MWTASHATQALTASCARAASLSLGEIPTIPRAGKQSADTYEEATRMLGTLPEQAVVIEDAISGVQAGRTGGFGLVIGVARSDDPEVLRQNGADIVVRDLAELRLV